jgi:hypothetical protein
MRLIYFLKLITLETAGFDGRIYWPVNLPATADDRLKKIISSGRNFLTRRENDGQ